MIGGWLVKAALTGAFCSVFALGVDAVLDMAGQVTVAMVAATSGFLGSLFASMVTDRQR